MLKMLKVKDSSGLKERLVFPTPVSRDVLVLVSGSDWESA